MHVKRAPKGVVMLWQVEMWNDTIFAYLYLLEVDFGKETSLSLFVI
jgi:hypothetical protein